MEEKEEEGWDKKILIAFDRKGKGKKITGEGESFVVRYQKVLVEIQKALSRFKEGS